jgi:1-aminocyclopropane-1-carboxylate deaminase
MATIPEKEPFIQLLQPSWYKPYAECLGMLRLDAIHPVVSGNKWYKLKHNIQYAIDNGYKSILTFGGAYSNHLIATAATAKEYDIHSIGIVRGVHNSDNLTDTLKDCKGYSMQLEMVSRDEYDNKHDAEYLEQLRSAYDKPFIIPEGGANKWGREGSTEIVHSITGDYTHICVSVGTGTTLTGIRTALPSNMQVSGYVPMKGGTYLKDEIDKYLEPEKQNAYVLFDEWHNGGFGKMNDKLIDFMNSFYAINAIPLDVVYTGKMMMGISEQLKAGYFPNNARILCIHTGGLQGNSSVKHLLNY